MNAPQQACNAITTTRSYHRSQNTQNAAVGPQIEGPTMSKMRKNKRTKYNPGAHRAARVTTWLNALLAGDVVTCRAVRLRMLSKRAEKSIRRSASIKTQA